MLETFDKQQLLLPEVDSSDAGRVLTVSEDGEWEAATPSGGGSNAVYYEILYDDNTANNYVSASFADIMADLAQNKNVYFYSYNSTFNFYDLYTVAHLSNIGGLWKAYVIGTGGAFGADSPTLSLYLFSASTESGNLSLTPTD